jgi:glycosyltransferase involved in cell wall biosynthesis
VVTVSVIVPVYRAEQNLPELYRQLAGAMAEITPVFELIFVEDDGIECWAFA